MLFKKKQQESNKNSIDFRFDQKLSGFGICFAKLSLHETGLSLF
jgi:hypothetical protein